MPERLWKVKLLPNMTMEALEDIDFPTKNYANVFATKRKGMIMDIVLPHIKEKYKGIKEPVELKLPIKELRF